MEVAQPQMRSQQEMELAAFEKGRLQGELEATRRMEAENVHREKQLLPAAGAAPVQSEVLRPDVIEINRLTWLQRAAALLGEGCTIAQVVLTIVWLDTYRGDVSWRDSDDGGNVSFWNTHYLVNSLGLFFLANAITNYRMGPINMLPMMNRIWYVFLQCCAVICFCLALTSMIRATPEREVWSVWQWTYIMAFSVVMLHSLYSIIVTCLEPLYHRSVKGNYGNWSGTGTHLETPEQRRDHSAYNHQARTVYSAAPVILHHPHPNDRHVPAAPGNAPRWAENPNTHAEDYWLLPRCKWATVGFWGIGATILMDLAASQQLVAAGNTTWASAVGPNSGGISQDGREMALLGALGIMTLGMLIFMSYVAMPPRTALVKSGILIDPNNRRSSISQTAETRIGNNNNTVV